MTPAAPDHGLTAPQVAALRAALAPFAARIERVDLFGSRATGRSRPNSDIDLVLCGDIDEPLLDRVRTVLNEAPLPVTVDVVADGLVDHAPLRAHIAVVRRTLFTRADLSEPAAGTSALGRGGTRAAASSGPR